MLHGLNFCFLYFLFPAIYPPPPSPGQDGVIARRTTDLCCGTTAGAGAE